jgi:hypothetical protein
MLNAATEPPDDVGQAIVIVTDGAPYTGGGGCSSTVTGGTSSYQAWLRTECANVTSRTTSSACATVGGKWSSSSCRASDNGAESTSWSGPGSCSVSASLYTTESRCEGVGGTWVQSGTAVPNPSTLTQWTDKQRLRAEDGLHREIDVYAVFYSAKHPSGAYHDDNLAFLRNHVVRGAGAEVGVLDAPTGDALIRALEDVCLDYARGDVGLLE